VFPAGGLNHRLARLEESPLLGVVDHRDREPVLHRPRRIEEFDLDVNGAPGRGDAVHPDDRGVADGTENVIVDHGTCSEAQGVRRLSRALAIDKWCFQAWFAETNDPSRHDSQAAWSPCFRVPRPLGVALTFWYFYRNPEDRTLDQFARTEAEGRFVRLSDGTPTTG
jgi:hypothetical protein